MFFFKLFLILVDYNRKYSFGSRHKCLLFEINYCKFRLVKIIDLTWSTPKKL